MDDRVEYRLLSQLVSALERLATATENIERLLNSCVGRTEGGREYFRIYRVPN